jgi:hypothetical protein
MGPDLAPSTRNLAGTRRGAPFSSVGVESSGRFRAAPFLSSGTPAPSPEDEQP